MFPEITRDEVFRIETPRLWLRWPVAADADALATIIAQNCTVDGAKVAQANAGALHGLIGTWRDDMAMGRALHFTLQLKAGDRQPIGIMHTSAERSCIATDQRVLGDEAATALRQMTALLGLPPPPLRNPPMAQQRILPPLAAMATCCLQA